MTKKFYWVTAHHQGCLGSSVPSQLATSRVFWKRKNAEKQRRLLIKCYPQTIFSVEWQWDDENGWNDYLRMANRGYYNEKNHVGKSG